MAFAFDIARTILHKCETIRVWIRVLIFIALKVEEEEEEDGSFVDVVEKTWRGVTIVFLIVLSLCWVVEYGGVYWGYFK